MKIIITTAAVAFCASFAAADLVDGQIIAQQDSDFSVRLISSDAGWTGELSWLSNIESEASPVLLMTNKSSTNAPPTQVGTVAAGEALYFQYEITNGTQNTFRQDETEGAQQFKYEWMSENIARLFVEDIKLPGGDADYNDAVFEIAFTPVPTPGVLAMAAISGGLFIKRRRK